MKKKNEINQQHRPIQHDARPALPCNNRLPAFLTLFHSFQFPNHTLSFHTNRYLRGQITSIGLEN